MLSLMFSGTLPPERFCYYLAHLCGTLHDLFIKRRHAASILIGYGDALGSFFLSGHAGAPPVVADATFLFTFFPERSANGSETR